MLCGWKRGEIAFDDIRRMFFWNGTNYSEFAEVDEAFVQAAAANAHDMSTSGNEDAVQSVLTAHGLVENPLDFYRILTAWRDERKRLNHTGLYALVRILREVARRHGIPPELVNGLVPYQANDFFEGTVSAEMLERQIRDGVLIVIEASGDISYRFGVEAQGLWEKNLAAIRSVQEHSGDIKGTVASRGTAIGRARILNDFNDPRAASFVQGDILVTSMTRPEFLPLMKLAAAFVTDEGGITSHAAIVSRELKKPCIIGTKIATQVLKDGDMVEVDAERGMVRRVS
jgi:phosphohistidine swiveling domain-containing protein